MSTLDTKDYIIDNAIIEVPLPEAPIVNTSPPKKAGRPKGTTKAALAERAKRKPGRPPNDTGRLAEFRQRLLGTNGSKIMEKLIEVALDDNHQGQMAALKLCVDRIVPLSSFADKGSAKPMVQVTIVNATQSDDNQVTIEMEETDSEVDE